MLQNNFFLIKKALKFNLIKLKTACPDRFLKKNRFWSFSPKIEKFLVTFEKCLVPRPKFSLEFCNNFLLIKTSFNFNRDFLKKIYHFRQHCNVMLGHR